MFGTKPSGSSTILPSLTVTTGDIRILEGDLYIGEQKVTANGGSGSGSGSGSVTLPEPLECKQLIASDAVRTFLLDSQEVTSIAIVTDELECNGSAGVAGELVAGSVSTGTITASGNASLKNISADNIICKRITASDSSASVVTPVINATEVNVSGKLTSNVVYGTSMMVHPPSASTSLTLTASLTYPTRTIAVCTGTIGSGGDRDVTIAVPLPLRRDGFGYFTSVTVPAYTSKSYRVATLVCIYGFDPNFDPKDVVDSYVRITKTVNCRVYRDTMDTTTAPHESPGTYYQYDNFATNPITDRDGKAFTYRTSTVDGTYKKSYYYENNSWYLCMWFTPIFDSVEHTYNIFYQDVSTYAMAHTKDIYTFLTLDPPPQFSLCYSLPQGQRNCFGNYYTNEDNPLHGTTVANFISPMAVQNNIVPLSTVTGVTTCGSLNVLKDSYFFGAVKIPTGKTLEFFTPTNGNTYQVLDATPATLTTIGDGLITVDTLQSTNLFCDNIQSLHGNLSMGSVHFDNVTSLGNVSGSSITTSGTLQSGALTCSSLNAGSGIIQTTGSVTATGGCTTGTINCDLINVSNMGSVNCGPVNCTTLNVQGNGPIYGGSVNCTVLTTGSGNIDGTLTSGAVTCTSLNAGSGRIQTTGILTSGAVTCTSLNAGAGAIQTTGNLICNTLVPSRWQPRWTSGWSQYSLTSTATDFKVFSFTHNLNISFTAGNLNLPDFRLFCTNLVSGTPVLGTHVIYEVALISISNSNHGCILTHTNANACTVALCHRAFFNSISSFLSTNIVLASSAESGQIMLVAY